MRTFGHASPESIEEAASILRDSGGKTRIIAGGTDLLGEMKDRITPDYPEILVNIKNIPGLDYVRAKGGRLHIGALTRLEDLAQDETVKEKYPALAEAARKTASPHIRKMGTVAGNICQNNRCWYYWVPENVFYCLRKGGSACYALTGDARYHSVFGAARVVSTACSRACPNSIDIAAYFSKIREDDLTGAAKILLETNPMPAVTGRVCPHWCESDCARGEFDEPVSIREIERFLGDYILDHYDEFYAAPQKKSGGRVAIVGSGPAGLSGAHYLRQAGHNVTIFERMPQAGGLLAYGIPPYRLPRDILHKQIEALKSTGIKFNLGLEVDKKELKRLMVSFDAVFVAAGAWRETEVGISGEECLMSGTDFLRTAYSTPREVAGKTIGVIGGGNTAIDVARSLLRLGAKPIIYYRRTKDEMPALDEEIEKAEEEGVQFDFLAQPVGANAEAEGALELTCCRMQLGELDESGRPQPMRIEGSEFAVKCDLVIKAIVERPDYSILPKRFVDENGRLKIEETACALGKGVFAGGDFVTGPATVAEAIDAGRNAAQAIDRFVIGKPAEPEVSAPVCTISGGWGGSCFEPSTRIEVPELSLAGRLAGLTIEETGTLEAGAVQTEANRCLNCGCVAVNSSDLAPVLIALRAKIRTTHRVIGAEDFFTAGINTSTVLDDGEMVLEIEVPRVTAGTKTTFTKFALRKSIDFSIVNCAAAIGSNNGVVKSARICLGSVYALPLRVAAAERFIRGKKIDEATAQNAADIAVKGALPLLTNRYKVQIARTLVKRAILACGPEGD